MAGEQFIGGVVQIKLQADKLEGKTNTVAKCLGRIPLLLLLCSDTLSYTTTIPGLDQLGAIHREWTQSNLEMSN